jgi:acetyl-CoA synthetase
MNGPLTDKPVYRQVAAEFSWNTALAGLGWSGEMTVDLAETIVDRHSRSAAVDRTAIVWVGADGSERRITFRQLALESARFANLLRRIGVAKGDRVAILLPRIPEVVPAMVGAFRVGAIIVPIFTGFGRDAVAYRIGHSGAKVVCVDRRYRDLVPSVESLTVISVGGSAYRDDIDYHRASASEDTQCVSGRYARDEPAAIIYTSGSTGLPKGCVIAANILAAMWPYAHYGLDLRPDTDVFWPTGDPSWGYGLCCYLPALAMGAPVLCVEPNATPEVCRDIIRRYKVTNLATTPTVLRSLMAQGDVIGDIGSTVRAISSCGEPLNSEVVEFFRDAWGVVPMDHFGATEFGLPIGNHNGLAMQVKSGSMGLPAPGQCMAVVDETGHELPPEAVGLIGQRAGDGSRYWLRYWNDDAATRALDRGGWICTGDLARRDTDGYFWFEGRSDDIIKSSGYRIGPFEIESAILEHGAAAEVAVVGVPDAVRGQAVKAFVVTRPGVEPSPRLADEMIEFVKARCGRYQSPREIQFVGSLPKTHSGKIQRFLLRQAARHDKVAP